MSDNHNERGWYSWIDVKKLDLDPENWDKIDLFQMLKSNFHFLKGLSLSEISSISYYFTFEMLQ